MAEFWNPTGCPATPTSISASRPFTRSSTIPSPPRGSTTCGAGRSRWAPPAERIHVIDIDQGHSGASAADREGFRHLVAEVSPGRAGIVLGLECSRLARDSADWQQLIKICAHNDCLICDEDGLYDPASFNDRLLLGLKGTMAESELHFLRARMQGGLLAKARRGELKLRLPAGLAYDAAGIIMLDPDTEVRGAVQLLLDTFTAAARPAPWWRPSTPRA